MLTSMRITWLSALALSVLAGMMGACADEPLIPAKAPGSPAATSNFAPNAAIYPTSPGYQSGWNAGSASSAAPPAGDLAPAPSPRRTIGHVSIGSARLSGGQVANVQTVLAGTAGGVRRCHLVGLHQSPTMAGSLWLRVAIGPTGQVRSVTPGAVTGLSQELVTCLLVGYQQVVFSPPDGAGEATLDVPITFTFAEMPRPAGQ